MSGRAPLLAFYGDDFTGSTDALESLSRAGARSVLFLEPPTAGDLARFPALDAFGVAGLTRSMAPGKMAATLRLAFTAFRELGVPIVHYKVCSTFDSSPAIGSIGCAAEVGFEIFRPPFIPIVVGAPGLGRYCVFGNLFARFGTAGEGAIHRLDRHPSMSRHPVTPADEADLRAHLQRQTAMSMALLDTLALASPLAEARRVLARLLEEEPEIVFFDFLDPAQGPTIGALLAETARADQPLFTIGSSGVGTALGAHWQGKGILSARTSWPALAPARPLLVLSGSASPVTGNQIQQAVSAGFAEVALDTAALLRDPESALPAARAQILEALTAGQHVVAHTCRGPADPRLATETRGDTAALLGGALGRLGRAAAEAGASRRLVFTGGDSSSFAARSLGLTAVQMLAPLAPGAPLCRAFSTVACINELEVNFKGGQVGAVDYFMAAAG